MIAPIWREDAFVRQSAATRLAYKKSLDRKEKSPSIADRAKGCRVLDFNLRNFFNVAAVPNPERWEG